MAFRPGGDAIATGHSDGSTRLWDTGLDRVAARICAGAYPRITRAEWARYFAAVDYDPPCPTT
ncbi:hypothetical protein J2Z21_001117 [Streptomyces griseochromogenes]|uniref:Uncharacterized protein n=1 Tax=Streptomyces griseochromogenes TaxID=68214 RepID=A0A1B1AUC4_9ACTN|nr:WD40 repeat domain-containing protein [Streptomyces griseochromogenes]ANP50166.1 hypothetical protein AVL59_11565 [Streptomyces griseochromogenes]MBP2048193.1 hypothetical protein [Streptomyces griseochromogenes]